MPDLPDTKVGLPELLALYPWLTERRVRSMVAEKRIRHWKVQGRLLFEPGDFQDLLDAGYVPAASGS